MPKNSYKDLRACQRQVALKKNKIYSFYFATVTANFRGAVFQLLCLLRNPSDLIRRPCDVLLLQPSQKSWDLGRKNVLIEKLGERGLCVEEDVIKSKSEILKQGRSRKGFLPGPLSLTPQLAFAEYLYAKYKPKIVMTERYDWNLSYALMRLKPEGVTVIHLAHCILEVNSYKFGLLCSDYAFIFGQSSLENLRRIRIRFGSAKVVLTGSYLLDNRLSQVGAKPGKSILLVGLGDKWENDHSFHKNYEIIDEWFNSMSGMELFVKPHAQSVSNFWDRSAKLNESVHKLDPRMKFGDALVGKSIVITIYSNAAIEAGAVGIPVIWVDWEYKADTFGMEKFFGKPCGFVEEIASRYAAIRDDYPRYSKKARDYSRYHLSNGLDSVDSIAESVKIVKDGGKLKHFVI